MRFPLTASHVDRDADNKMTNYKPNLRVMVGSVTCLLTQQLERPVIGSSYSEIRKFKHRKSMGDCNQVRQGINVVFKEKSISSSSKSETSRTIESLPPW